MAKKVYLVITILFAIHTSGQLVPNFTTKYPPPTAAHQAGNLKKGLLLFFCPK